MSLGVQSKPDLPFAVAEPRMNVTASYCHEQRGWETLTGSVTASHDSEILIHVTKPHHLEAVYIANCEEYWAEGLTVCHQDWRRLGRVTSMLINGIPTYISVDSSVW